MNKIDTLISEIDNISCRVQVLMEVESNLELINILRSLEIKRARLLYYKTYGFNCNDKVSIVDIAELFGGVSKQRIKQVEAKALKKIKPLINI